MQAYFGKGTESFHVRKFRDAMEAIADGSADYAVLPIENTTAGIVADNFDLLVDFENYIVAEQIIPVEHVLMACPGTRIEDVKTEPKPEAKPVKRTTRRRKNGANSSSVS
jgi:chorismate mutase/prephenate dehydratase